MCSNLYSDIQNLKINSFRDNKVKVGDVRFSSPVSMRNEWTTVRIQHKVAGNKLDRKLAMGIPMVRRDATGKQVKDTANMWISL